MRRRRRCGRSLDWSPPMPDIDKKLRKKLLDYCDFVQTFVLLTDRDFEKPAANDKEREARGRRLASRLNDLEMATDGLRYFTLGVDSRGKGEGPPRRKRLLAKWEKAYAAHKQARATHAT